MPGGAELVRAERAARRAQRPAAEGRRAVAQPLIPDTGEGAAVIRASWAGTILFVLGAVVAAVVADARFAVAIIDVASRKQVRSIDGVGNRPWGIALSPDGARLFTANGSSLDLSIVNLATGNVDRRVTIGGLPWGVVLGT